MFSSTSFAEWKKVGTNVHGITFYLDFERIRKHDGYVYYWYLTDFLKPEGYWSHTHYIQGDCKLFRYKILSAVFHKHPMGRDTGDIESFENPSWISTFPKEIITHTLKLVCDHVTEWTEVGYKVEENKISKTFYVDIERIRKANEFVYWWSLNDYLKPLNGNLSGKVYHRGDCKLFRIQNLEYSHHKEPMGKDSVKTITVRNPEWKYPSPRSMDEMNLKFVCSR
jgi:hypothetical protein